MTYDEIAEYRADDVCIVGRGCVLPDAASLDAFWKNLLQGTCSIKPMPENRLKKSLYFSENSDDEDTTNSCQAAIVDENTVEEICQQNGWNRSSMNKLNILALEATKQALHEFGQVDPDKKTAIAIGCMSPDEDISHRIFVNEEQDLERHIKERVENRTEEVCAVLSTEFEQRRKKLRM